MGYIENIIYTILGVLLVLTLAGVLITKNATTSQVVERCMQVSEDRARECETAEVFKDGSYIVLETCIEYNHGTECSKPRTGEFNIYK